MKDEGKIFEYYFAREVSQDYTLEDDENIHFGNKISNYYHMYKKVGEHLFQNLITEEIVSDLLDERVVPTKEFYEYAVEYPYAIADLEKAYEGPYYNGLYTNLLADLQKKNQLEEEKEKHSQVKARIKNIFKRSK